MLSSMPFMLDNQNMNVNFVTQNLSWHSCKHSLLLSVFCFVLFFLEVNYCLYFAFIFKKVFGTFNKCSRGLINVLKSNS